MTEHIDDILRRIGREEKQPSSVGAIEATTKVAPETRSVVELAHAVIDRFVGVTPDLRIGHTQHKRVPPTMRTSVGMGADLENLVRIQEARMHSLMKLNEMAVATAEHTTKELRKEEAVIQEWVEKEVRELEKKRATWHGKAEELVAEKGSQIATSRVALEKEWDDFARNMPPTSHARRIIQSNLPLQQRAHLAGGGATDTMISRVRRDADVFSGVQNVHWKLRQSVDSLIDHMIASTRNSGKKALHSVSAGAVGSARQSIQTAHAQYKAQDATEKQRADVLERSLDAKQVPYAHLMGYCANRLEAQRGPLLERLRELL